MNPWALRIMMIVGACGAAGCQAATGASTRVSGESIQYAECPPAMFARWYEAHPPWPAHENAAAIPALADAHDVSCPGFNLAELVREALTFQRPIPNLAAIAPCLHDDLWVHVREAFGAGAPILDGLIGEFLAHPEIGDDVRQEICAGILGQGDPRWAGRLVHAMSRRPEIAGQLAATILQLNDPRPAAAMLKLASAWLMQRDLFLSGMRIMTAAAQLDERAFWGWAAEFSEHLAADIALASEERAAKFRLALMSSWRKGPARGQRESRRYPQIFPCLQDMALGQPDAGGGCQNSGPWAALWPPAYELPAMWAGSMSRRKLISSAYLAFMTADYPGYAWDDWERTNRPAERINDVLANLPAGPVGSLGRLSLANRLFGGVGASRQCGEQTVAWGYAQYSKSEIVERLFPVPENEVTRAFTKIMPEESVPSISGVLASHRYGDDMLLLTRDGEGARLAFSRTDGKVRFSAPIATAWGWRYAIADSWFPHRITARGKAAAVRIGVALPGEKLTSDVDRDGLPDWEERSLGMNVREEDSDGDGISDAADSYPLCPRNSSLSLSGVARERETVDVLAAAVWKLFAAYPEFCPDRCIIVVAGRVPVKPCAGLLQEMLPGAGTLVAILSPEGYRESIQEFGPNLWDTALVSLPAAAGANPAQVPVELFVGARRQRLAFRNYAGYGAVEVPVLRDKVGKSAGGSATF